MHLRANAQKGAIVKLMPRICQRPGCGKVVRKGVAMPHLKAGYRMMVGDPSQPRSQWKEYVVLKPFYVMRGEPSEPSVSAREYTVVIAVSFDGGIVHELLSEIHLTATQAAELLK